MKISIHNKRKVFAIQQSFSKEFPNLKLEFKAKASHAAAKASSKSVAPNALIGACRNTRNDGVITIQPSMTAHELEKFFSNSFGLTVLVYRRSEKGIVKITASDKTSLFEQNNAAALHDM